MNHRGFFRTSIATWIHVDLERYDNLKAENKKLKNKLLNILNELNTQFNELKLPCKRTPDTLNNHYPKESEIKDRADAYNRAANSARLISKQKINYIKSLLEA